MLEDSNDVVYYDSLCVNFVVCLVSSLSAARSRLHWAKIYIVAVMLYKTAQALSAVCNYFMLECHIR